MKFKLSRTKLILFILIVVMVVGGYGLLIWAIKTGKINPRAQTNNQIENTATITYDGLTEPISSNKVVTQISSDAGLSIDLTLTLQGRDYQNVDYSASNGLLKVYQVGQSAKAATPLFEKSDITIDASGHGQVDLSELTAGNYDLRLKIPGFLSVLLTNKEISNGVAINFGAQKAGDIMDNNQVDMIDFGAMLNSWRLKSVDTGFNSVADIYKDQQVNVIDFNLMLTNWRQAGI